jgi:tetratricopeptide (TPR) repeat protein
VLEILDEAEATFGQNPALDEARRLHNGSLNGDGAPKQRPVNAESVWDLCAVARSLLRAGDLQGAVQELDRAVRLEPSGLWPNFYLGVCAYHQGRYEDAVAAFSVCIGAAPRASACYFNRALAQAARKQYTLALRDYDAALQYNPSFAAAAINRAMLLSREGRHSEAIEGLQRVLAVGEDVALVHYDLAVVELARGDRAAAMSNLRRSLESDPNNDDARELLQNLEQRP